MSRPDPHAIRTADSAGGSGRRRPQSLAGGAAGIALLHIERARGGHGDWTTAHAWLSTAVRDNLSAGPNASLLPACSSAPRPWRSSPTRRPAGRTHAGARQSRHAWTHLSGAAELVIAASRTRRLGGLLAALLFVAVFPANVKMAIDWSDRPAWMRALVYAQIPLVLWAVLAYRRAAVRPGP